MAQENTVFEVIALGEETDRLSVKNLIGGCHIFSLS